MKVQQDICTGCGTCSRWCPRDAISVQDFVVIDHERCDSCGECMYVCSEGAIEVEDPRPNRNIYDGFAKVYRTGQYIKFSKKMSEILSGIIEEFEVEGHELLDVACGEGTFAVEMAYQGYDVTGIDISRKLLDSAEEKDLEKKIDFIQQDMRDISFQEEFDIATCWYDSLNYILDKEELREVFSRVFDSLRYEGLFIFDMNTLHVMEEVWTDQAMVKEDSAQRFDMVEQRYEEEKNVTSIKLTSFIRNEKESWKKIEEVHRERAYSLSELKRIFEEVGFEELARWEDPEEMIEAGEESSRVWFVLQKE